MLTKDGTMEMKNEMKWKTCRQCFTYSVNQSMAGLVSEITQKFEQKILFIGDGDMWIGDNARWLNDC